MANDHHKDSADFARLAQSELARRSGNHSRGVKQAPFVVLTGVQMPALLVEIGFITNADDAGMLRGSSGREAVVDALAAAVVEFGRRYDARRGRVAVPASGG
jgi:N-acetylmuramoyl-L-alanine amidase